MTVRATVVGVCALVAALLSAPGAPAHVSSLRVDTSSPIIDGGRAAAVTGVVTCEFGEEGRVQVSIQQSKGQRFAVGSGGADLTCTGKPEAFAVAVELREGDPFAPGPATARATAFALHPGIGFDTESVELTVRLRR